MNFLFYQSTVLSSRAEDGHQMYFGGSIRRRNSLDGGAPSDCDRRRQRADQFLSAAAA